jgi:protein-S-isoprenylcysteine O-methyltransferase Ste14
MIIPLFMYLSYRVLIVEEERYLGDKFGGEYLEYKRKVGAIFPKFQTLFRKRINKR